MIKMIRTNVSHGEANKTNVTMAEEDGKAKTMVTTATKNHTATGGGKKNDNKLGVQSETKHVRMGKTK